MGHALFTILLNMYLWLVYNAQVSGPEFKKICEKNGIKPEQIAEAVGVHANTVLLWFRSAVLDRRTQLALTQLGYIPSKGHAAERAIKL